jgi:dTDP-4-dehydrorhamnose 3,5-epimerase
MRVLETALEGVLLIELEVYADPRGWFAESYRADRYAEAGIAAPFLQDNVSRSVRGTLRGLHFQEPHPQGKLVQVLRGALFDVAVDVRLGSPTFGRWVGVELSDDNHRQLFIPPGFAHGFCVTSESADFFYKCTAVWSPEAERAVAWNDPDLAIEWPVAQPLVSVKDARAPRLREAPVLPRYQP